MNGAPSRFGHIRSYSCVVALAIGLLASQAPAAQDIARSDLETPQVLTLAEAVSIARTGAPDVAAAQNDVARQRQALAVDRASNLPEVGLTLGLFGRRGLAFDETAGRLVNELNWSLGTGVTASYPVSDLIARPAVRRQGRLLVTAAQLRAERAEGAAGQETTALYMEWLAADGDLGLLDFNLQSARVLFALAADLVEAGLRPASDITLQLAEVQQARLARVNGRRAAAVAESALETFLGLDPTTDRRPAMPDTSSLEALEPLDVYLASVDRADLRADQAVLKAAEAQRESAGLAWIPDVSLSLGGATSFTSANSEVGLVDQLTQNPSQRAGLSVSVPLLGRSDAAREQNTAAAAVLDAEVQLDRTRRAINREVAEAHVEARAAEDAVAVARDRVEAAARAVRVQQSLYELGAIDITALTQAHNVFLNASADLVRARVQHVSSRHRLQYAVRAMPPSLAPGVTRPGDRGPHSPEASE